MRLVFTPNGWQDYTCWQSADRATLKRISRFIDDVLRDPFEGIGKPEPLRHALTGAWSRRISEEHHLVFSNHVGQSISRKRGRSHGLASA